MRLRDGFPAVVRPPLDDRFGAVLPGERPNTAVGFFERERPTPISYQHNLNVQREVAADTVVEVGYMGNVSHHLTANDLSLSQVPPELLGSGDAQARRPFPQFSNVSMLNPAVGNSTYHGVFVKSERRFANGFSFLAHYTYSKFIDDVASGDEFGDPGSYMNQYNRRLDKGLSGTDLPQHLLFTGLYQIRQFKNNKALNLFAGGWQLAGIQQMH